MKLGKKSYYTHKLDTLISQKVRAVGRCSRCGGRSNLQAAHVISRNNRTLRFDLNNLLCLCSGCHFWAHQDPLGFAEFVKEKMYKRWAYLMYRKDAITKRSAQELKELYDSLKGDK